MVMVVGFVSVLGSALFVYSFRVRFCTGNGSKTRAIIEMQTYKNVTMIGTEIVVPFVCYCSAKASELSPVRAGGMISATEQHQPAAWKDTR